MAVKPISVAQKRITPHKAIVEPVFAQRNVLTNSPWTFVDLWLRREKNDTATFYWEQARQLYAASTGLPMQSAPLLLYYAFMNASKALLESKGVSYVPYHGVSEARAAMSNKKLSLGSLKVFIKQSGVLPSLSAYFQETESNHTHAMEDLLYNLPFGKINFKLVEISAVAFIEIQLNHCDPGWNATGRTLSMLCGEEGNQFRFWRLG